jgi:hypothetical protein
VGVVFTPELEVFRFSHKAMVHPAQFWFKVHPVSALLIALCLASTLIGVTHLALVIAT